MDIPEESDEDFQLPLRAWLEKQINSGKFKGLEWEDTDDGSKQFRLPWVKKNFPDWEEYFKIFRAWASHRWRKSRLDQESKLDSVTLKANFRCALNKSVDFEEVTSKSTLHLQTGNYKVYRFLSPNEVREKRRKNKEEMERKEKQAEDELTHEIALNLVAIANNRRGLPSSIE